MDCEYHFALTQRAKQDVRQNVGYIRNELGNEKAAGMLMNELDKCIERLCISAGHPCAQEDSGKVYPVLSGAERGKSHPDPPHRLWPPGYG